jgi:hypothetical protein
MGGMETYCMFVVYELRKKYSLWLLCIAAFLDFGKLDALSFQILNVIGSE